ncbi:MAG: Asp-tRNA(Asn)/Glu-tRNA(Gln) amidotransferase subunit GatC [Oscillospiraceae bacterium]|nr:Asp-tRNA(Asn)/Glu-tRNA(Gln) amidotransferase subunit GatC [Oscillospiraceae bacterium]
MPITIDNGLISYLEDLSYLSLTDEEKQRLGGDLRAILEGMDCLGKLDTENVPERSHPFDDVNAFRSDEVKESFGRELILKNAPHTNAEMFIVPQAIEIEQE